MLPLKMLLVFISAVLNMSTIEATHLENISFDGLVMELSIIKKELSAMKEQVQEVLSLKEQVNQLININSELWRHADYANNISEGHSSQDDTEERLEKLEEMSKVGTLRTCNEYSAFGIKTSGQYTIDPDGLLVGEPPFTVSCQFDQEGGAVTEIFHNTEDIVDVEHCHDPGCSKKNVTYTSGMNGEPIPLTQLDALIALSSSCEQSFYYECTLAPLRAEGLDYGYWTGRHGEKNVYFTGGDSSFHACDCHFTEEGCEEEELKQNTCNCDSNLPVPLVDTGLISNMSALPILSMAFGGLSYEIQTGAYRIGRLSCKGEELYEKATSCESLKRNGETHSGYFTVKKDGSLHTSTVFCDMSDGGYNDIPENTELSTDSPLGTIAAWIPRNNMTSDINNLPDGWLPCDGRVIERGPWTSGRTPDLNTNGYFLRGGIENDALVMEEDEVQDHEHMDPGHTHGNSPHTHSQNDHYGLQKSYAGTANDNADYHNHPSTTGSATISITSAKTNLGGVSSEYRAGRETRPRNMKIIWIIRLW